MTASRHAAIACKLLANATHREVDSPSADERTQAIAALEQAIQHRNRRRRATKWVWAAAATVVLGLGAGRLALRHGGNATPPAPTLDVMAGITVVGHPAGGGATVVDTASSGPLADGRALAPGSRIVARSDGHVVLSLSTGTELVVEEGADVSIVDNGPTQVFAVRAGAVRAHVAKLDQHERFLIRTLDTDVEVRGTSFRVSLVEPDPACGGGTTTRVSVSEGVVSVRHGGTEARIGAGQEWPAGCSAKPKRALAARPGKEALGVAAPRGGITEAPPSPIDSAPIASDLGEQNDSFSRALAAKKRGASREAIDGFEVFIARYPASPLVESAMAQRMDLLATIDVGRARAAAEQYLARYPRGFAASEAATIRRASP